MEVRINWIPFHCNCQRANKLPIKLNPLKDNVNEKKGFALSKFAGLASQWAVALVALIFLGKYMDQKQWIAIKMPLFIWLLPFAFIVISLVDIVKETNTKAGNKNNNQL